MPSPIYFYPFTQRNYSSGGPLGVVDAKTALHWVAPTLGSADFAYLWKMGANSSTFANHMSRRERIYVMGRCNRGVHQLSTGAHGANPTCTAAQLATYFHDHGLFKGSSTHIRIHACNSGEPHGNRKSFAEEFKNQMVQLGYTDLTIRGYLSKVGIYLFSRLGEHGKASAPGNIIDYTPPLAVT